MAMNQNDDDEDQNSWWLKDGMTFLVSCSFTTVEEYIFANITTSNKYSVVLNNTCLKTNYVTYENILVVSQVWLIRLKPLTFFLTIPVAQNTVHNFVMNTRVN